MKTTLTIDVGTVELGPYGSRDAKRAFTVSVGADCVEVALTNIPKDLSERVGFLEAACEEKQAKINELRDLPTNPDREVQRLQAEIERLNDAPRPAVSDETLKEILWHCLPSGMAIIPRIKLVRVLTGWGLQQAKTFVESVPVEVVPVPPMLDE